MQVCLTLSLCFIGILVAGYLSVMHRVRRVYRSIIPLLTVLCEREEII